jgi:putative methyltransferase (TIGR04325 family)
LNFKGILKKILPPILFDIRRYIRDRFVNDALEWQGNFSSWDEAMLQCKGYNAPNILESCKTALLKVKNGEAAYERDSVVFDDIHYSYPLLVTLQHAALNNNGNLCVLDFGGSLGSSYYQNKAFLKSMNRVEWCIIEQANFVTCGKIHFEDNILKFYETVEECLKIHKPDVLLLSGVLQCINKPHDWLQTFIKLKFPYIVLDRTTFVDNSNDILTIQNTPAIIYEASYPTWFFNFDKLIKPFKEHYTPIFVFDSFADGKYVLENNKIASWKGVVLKKNA